MTNGDSVPEFLEEWHEETVWGILTSAVRAHGVAYRGTAWFRWKFRDSPHGPAIVCIARTRSGQVAGVVAYGRWRLTYGAKDIHAGVSYETFVHPDFRGRGLFTALAAAAAQYAAREGIEILFNFPNPASRPGFLKLGWRDMGGIQTWVRPQSPLRVLTALLRRRNLSLGPLAADLATALPGEEALPAWLRTVVPLRHEGVLVSARSWDLVRWRFFTFPTFRYAVWEGESLGCVYRTGERSGLREAQLMELLPGDPRTGSPPAPAAIRGLLRQLGRAGGFDAFSMVTTRGTALASALARSGFVKAPNHASFLCLPLTAGFEDLRDSRQWSLTTTDIHTF